MSLRIFLFNLVLGILATVMFIWLAGCTYGTYNASGSYPNQDNSGCQKEKHG